MPCGATSELEIAILRRGKDVSASCSLGTSGTVAAASESTLVRDAHKLRTWMLLKMASWQKFVILRASKLRGVRGPGLFLIIPMIDSVVAVIDERVQRRGGPDKGNRTGERGCHHFLA